MATPVDSVEFVTVLDDDDYRRDGLPADHAYMLQTFGCGCCSSEEVVGPEQAKAALLSLRSRLELHLANVNLLLLKL